MPDHVVPSTKLVVPLVKVTLFEQGAWLQHELQVPAGQTWVRLPCLTPGTSAGQVQVRLSAGNWRLPGPAYTGGLIPNPACPRPAQQDLLLETSLAGGSAVLRLAYFSPDARWQQRQLIQLNTAEQRVWTETQQLLHQTTGQDWVGVRVELVSEADSFMRRQWRADTAGPILTLEPPAQPAPPAAQPLLQTRGLLTLASGEQTQLPGSQRSEPVPVSLLNRVWLSDTPQAYLVARSPALAQLLQKSSSRGSWLLVRDGEALGAYRINPQDARDGELAFGVDRRLQLLLGPVSRRYGGDGHRQHEFTHRTLMLRAGPSPHAVEVLAAQPRPEVPELDVECSVSPAPDAGAWRGLAGISVWRFDPPPVNQVQLQQECRLSYPVNRAPRPAPAPPTSSR